MSAAGSSSKIQFDVDRIGLLGGVRGRLSELVQVLDVLSSRGVRLIVQLGDFGVPWPTGSAQRDLAKLTRRLALRGQRLLFLAGSHDWSPMLNDRSGLTPDWSPEGIRWLSSRVGFLPNGFRASFSSGRSFAVLGGAASVDRAIRTRGVDWWPEELATEQDLQVLGDEHSDVLFGHDAPLDLPEVDAAFATMATTWPLDDIRYAIAGRATFHRGFLQVAPSLYVGSHYERFIIDAVGFRHGSLGFWSNIAMLDQLDGPGASVAILDTTTLALDYLDRDGSAVPREPATSKLTLESKGRWHVQTESSVHLLDFDEGHWERLPGPDANPYPGRNEGQLRSLENFILGSNGYLTTVGDDFFEYYWAHTSMIRHITPAPPTT
ncbi:hypothetical protein GE115_12475 [Agromyces sp. CFH 90414]|uniref:Calcineurin-like phosphoesterase domain-containing protein n=1 Tax=Agromyces agglutinans TaxID=2662258 RepID=A0A6I2FA56_9MICO|nr:hypothetical protein [Agromyces agglutinans]MRG60677.1 hypothetical protein [Agromyces agglutinans]